MPPYSTVRRAEKRLGALSEEFQHMARYCVGLLDVRTVPTFEQFDQVAVRHFPYDLACIASLAQPVFRSGDQQRWNFDALIRRNVRLSELVARLGHGGFEPRRRDTLPRTG